MRHRLAIEREPNTDLAGASIANHDYLAEFRRKGQRAADYGVMLRFIRKFGYALLNEQALDSIVRVTKASGIVSIGAGMAYNEYLLSKRGVKVVCYDTEPPSKTFGGITVKNGDATIAGRHPGRALFLSYPEKINNMAQEAVDSYLERGGHTVIVITEDSNSVLGTTPQFLSFILFSLPNTEGWQRLRTPRMEEWPDRSRLPYFEIVTRKKIRL